MKKLLRYLPFHVLLFLIAGIAIQFFTGFWSYGKKPAGLCFILLICCLWSLRKTKIFVGFSWLLFLFLGIIVTYLGDHRNNEKYFAYHTTQGSSKIIGIQKVLKPGSFHHRYYAEIQKVDDRKTAGLVLLNVRKDDSTSNGLKVGDRLYTTISVSEIKSPKNLHEFDYKKYLEKQGVYGQMYLETHEFLKLKEVPSIKKWIEDVRSEIQLSLQVAGFSGESYAVMNALLLGQRQEISKELLDRYSKAGAIHILAISGLHVGILLWILLFFFKPVERIKNGRFVKLILIVLCLWFFALIAGMSASVVRAVTMFTAVAFGQALQRRNSIEYSLIFSMFLLLLLKPLFLFDVGFQLSYLAVFGIIWMQPRIANLWSPQLFITRKLWVLTTVSLSAQLAVLPLSLYYFHQFPGLFIVSNLVIVPFLGIILASGFFVIILSLFSILPNVIVVVYEYIIVGMNSFVQFISEQEAFLFSDISFSLLKMLASYLLLIFGFQFFTKLNARALLLFLFSILTAQSIFIIEEYKTHDQKEWIVFHKNGHSIYGVRKGRTIEIYSSLGVEDVSGENSVKSYALGENAQLIFAEHSKNYFVFQTHQILLVDQSGIYQLKGLQSPIVILKDSPKINLKRLIEKLQPRQIVADGSNYLSFVTRWKETCDQTKTPFWTTGQNGAYIFDVKD